MAKTDRFLYGGFAVVAIGFVVAMLVTVFSHPKQVMEETVETPMPPQTEPAPMETAAPVDDLMPPDGYVGYYLDDDGNKVWLTAENIAASDAIEAEKKWWESRQDWGERFPFEPTHHPEIAYDPDAFRASREMRDLARNHSLLKMFYESWVPYTEEFEQMHDIVKEELGEVGSTVALAITFRTLAKYHKAAQRDPDSIYRENVRVELPKPEPVNTMVALGPEFYSLPLEKQIQISNEFIDAQIEAMRANNTQKYEGRDVTWAEEVEITKECLLGPLEDLQIGEERIHEKQALAIRKRLINEIPAAGFLELPKRAFACNQKHEKERKAGDLLFIKEPLCLRIGLGAAKCFGWVAFCF